ncbi:hypothetical protein [Acinetobacter baumannii]|uniref:hypothetical protein n=1 Tax=Acinetobacter baumannii TaxID=470 RepID=UPI002305D220|nr:hypothetical protein [Acinetobacter baumannii]
MEKFEEYFRTTKHYENMLLDIARNQLSVSVFDKNGRKYRNHIVQTAYEVFQHQQAKVEELQKRLYGALKETQYALQYVEGDMRGNHEFLQMAMIRTFKALEQVLKGDQYDEHRKKAEEAISKGASLTNHRIEL